MGSSITFSAITMAGPRITPMPRPTSSGRMTGMVSGGIRGTNETLITGRVLRNGIPIGATTNTRSIMTRNFMNSTIAARVAGGIKASMASVLPGPPVLAAIPLELPVLKAILPGPLVLRFGPLGLPVRPFILPEPPVLPFGPPGLPVLPFILPGPPVLKAILPELPGLRFGPLGLLVRPFIPLELPVRPGIPRVLLVRRCVPPGLLALAAMPLPPLVLPAKNRPKLLRLRKKREGSARPGGLSPEKAGCRGKSHNQSKAVCRGFGSQAGVWTKSPGEGHQRTFSEIR